MSFFNRILASVGIGSAKVDTRLEHSHYSPGDEVRGVVYIRGGNVEQQIDGIYIQLLTQYTREKNDQKATYTEALVNYHVTGAVSVRPGEELEFPVAFRLPLQTPATFDRVRVWVKTGLDIAGAADPADDDYLEITPHPYTGIVLEAIESLGFRIHRVENEYAPYYGRGVPFVQEFEFLPGGSYYGRLDELEAIFYPKDDGIEVLLEVDRRARGFMGFLEEAMDADERRVAVRFSHSELDRGVGYVEGRIAEVLDHYAR